MSHRRGLAGPLAALFFVAITFISVSARAYDGGRFGQVTLAEPRGEIRGFVFLFSDRGGWTGADDARARGLADSGALVVEVDTDAYLKRLDGLEGKCHSPEADAEGFSRWLQRERGYANYLTPILAGVGEGGTLARVGLAQAPAATIAGAVSIDPTPFIASQRPLCAASPPVAADGGFGYGPTKTLPGFWSVGLTAEASADVRKHLNDLHAAGMPVELHQFANEKATAKVLQALVEPRLTPTGPSRERDVAGLPLVELPVGRPSGAMAVILSGDGGWRDLDKTVAEHLQADGVPVVGWDSLRYFWSKKTPEQTAGDLEKVLEAYMARWHATRVALIGYSFGAGVLPFAYNRLPAAVRSRVSLITLLGFDKAADFEASPMGWLGAPPSADALPVGPEIDRIPGTLIQCFYGKDEEESACPPLSARGAEVIRTTGGHHFDGDYASLARQILEGLKRRAD